MDDEKNESMKVIDDWLVFVDGHVDQMEKEKTDIKSNVSNLDSEKLKIVADTLKETQVQILNAQETLNDLWKKIFGKE